MSSIALKFSSLAIRTLSKPIANFIKRQAHEHDGFRRTCISFAQSLHRLDMRLRLGLLQDVAAIERQAAKEAAKHAAEKHKHSIPTVKTEAEMKAEEKAAARATQEDSDTTKQVSKPRIRPLSEAKAVETGANFISEAFLFSVAAGLIVFESWRSRRKETTRREDVADRLADLEESEKAARRALIELEHEVLRLRATENKEGKGPVKRILPREVYELTEKKDEPDEKVSGGWLSWIVKSVSGETDSGEKEQVGPAEKILAEADAALAEKHRQAALEAQAAQENTNTKKK